MSQFQNGLSETEVRKRSRKKARQRIALRRSKYNRNIFRFFIAAVVIVLLACVISKDKAYSDTENRPLTQFPTISRSAIIDGSLFSGLDNWFSDQFFVRDGWISLHLREMKFLGFRESGGVYLGSDGYLLMESETPDENAIADTVAAVNQLAMDHPELNTTVIIVPNAASVMKAQAPKNMPDGNQNDDVLAMEAMLDDTIHCVDAGKVMEAHASEDIYYSTDHHWTSLGAYYTYQAAVDALDIRDYITSFDTYTVTDEFQGTLASKSGSHARCDTVEVYIPKSDVSYHVTRGEENNNRTCSIYNLEALEQNDKYTVFFGGNYSKVDIMTTANNGRKLLVFKDSYANSFIQFLIPCYEEIVMIDPRYYYGTLDELLSRNITDVLYLYSADTILTTTTLKDVLNSVSTVDIENDVAESTNETDNQNEQESSVVDAAASEEV